MVPGAPGEAPTDGYTQRDIKAKAQVEGSLFRRPRAAAVPAARIAKLLRVGCTSGRWVRGHDGRDREAASAEQAPRPASTRGRDTTRSRPAAPGLEWLSRPAARPSRRAKSPGVGCRPGGGCLQLPRGAADQAGECDKQRQDYPVPPIIVSCPDRPVRGWTHAASQGSVALSARTRFPICRRYAGARNLGTCVC